MEYLGTNKNRTEKIFDRFNKGDQAPSLQHLSKNVFYSYNQ